MPPQVKKWTVMVYMAGDNNLDSAGVADLNEMKQTGSGTDINVVAQFDRASAAASTNRYYLRHGTSLAADAVASLGETNMGDKAVLESFLHWGTTNYPADHYLVVLWNHGSGWDDTDIYRTARRMGFNVTRRGGIVQKAEGRVRGRVPTDQMRAVADRFSRSLFASTVEAAIEDRGIAYDDQAKDFLDNMEVKRAFSDLKTALGRPIDILGMDACLMNMIEVAYQVRGSTAFMVGSEQVEPEAGWPYDKILAPLAADPDMTPRDLSKLIVTKYLASYGASDEPTQSALDQSMVATVREAVEGLAHALLGFLSNPTMRAYVRDARYSTLHYYTPEYVDLIDLCKQLMARPFPEKAKTVCRTAVGKLMPFIVANGSKGAAVAGSGGVSIYFPTNGVSTLYATLDFARQSKWAKFIKAFQARRR